MAETRTAHVEGSCDSKFAPVKEEFARNFAERGEVGASVCVTVDGRKVVDLWGGDADPASGRAWDTNTVSVVWSCTKGATALCAHILLDRKELDLDAPVKRYWPEFARNGKEAITVRMLLKHQAAVAAIRQPVPEGGFNDWEWITAALAEEAPFWEPGTRNGYHAFTFGWLVGEVVRRVSGKSLGTFFRDEVAGPLGIDFHIGAPEEVEARVAPILFPPPPGPGEDPGAFFVKAMSDPTSVQGLVVLNNGGWFGPGCNLPAAHAAEVPAAGGITNARGLASMYAPLAGSGDNRLLSEEAVVRMGAVSSATGVDAVLLAPTRFALGYCKSIDNRALWGPNDSIILSEEAFGHSGVGGSLGFADPKRRMSFGYTMNSLGGGVGINARGQSLVDATYKALGARSNASGTWV